MYVFFFVRHGTSKENDSSYNRLALVPSLIEVLHKREPNAAGFPPPSATYPTEVVTRVAAVVEQASAHGSAKERHGRAARSCTLRYLWRRYLPGFLSKELLPLHYRNLVQGTLRAHDGIHNE